MNLPPIDTPHPIPTTPNQTTFPLHLHDPIDFVDGGGDLSYFADEFRNRRLCRYHTAPVNSLSSNPFS